MELYAKGQLSYLILNCLLERDFYGLDIITEINSKSAGKVNLKKPSVYSNLTRMEKQGYVSSYLKSSDLGPNRKYYSLTDKGREFYNEIDTYFKRNNIDVFSEFSEGEELSKQPDMFENEDNLVAESPAEEVIQPDKTEDDFFDFSAMDEIQKAEDKPETEHFETKSLEEQSNINNEESVLQGYTQNDSEPQETEEYIEEPPVEYPLKVEETLSEGYQTSANETDSQNSYKFSIRNALLSNQSDDEDDEIKTKIAKQSVQKDDAVFLEKQEVSDYNQRLYDISKDINSYKKKKSFAEDQISITAEAPLLSSSNERRKANLEEFKSSLIQNKENYSQNQNVFTRFTNYKDKLGSMKTSDELEVTKKQELHEIKKDDGKFIVAHVDSSTIEKPRKIEPPRLKVLQDSGKDKLPAPKRDSSIDPSHQEILSRLYAKTKGSSSEQQRDDCLYDYTDLKDFYKNQNIPFDVYEKPKTSTAHNTNKLYFVASLITLILASLISGILYVVLASTSMLNTRFNFLYIVLPLLICIDVGLQAYRMTKYKGWLPKQIMPQWKIWTITLAFMTMIVGINFAFGMASEEFALFATTLILPLLLTLVVIPFRYYVKRYLIIKKWR